MTLDNKTDALQPRKASETYNNIHPFVGIASIEALYAFMYSAMLSSLFFRLPLLGSAMYLFAHLAVLFFRMQRPPREYVFSAAQKRATLAVIIVCLFLMAAIVVFYPKAVEGFDLWILSGIVLVLNIRPVITRFFIEKDLINNKKIQKAWLRALLVHIAFLAPIAALFFSTQTDQIAWYLIGGFALSGPFEFIALISERNYLKKPAVSFDRQYYRELLKVNAYKKYQNMTMVVAASLQITQIMTFSYIGVTASALFKCMLLSMMCTYISFLLTSLVLNRTRSLKHDPANILLIGLAVWFYGLILFSRNLNAAGGVNAYLSLGLCTIGAAMCVRTLVYMENDIRRVIAFSSHRKPDPDFDWYQTVRIEFAAVTGQMISLVALALICIFTVRDYSSMLENVIVNFNVWLIVPAVIMVIIAFVSTLLFPLTRDHLKKLKRYMALQEAGEDNDALQEQLENVVIRKSLKHYGVRIIIFVLRLFYHHKVIGKEFVKTEDGVPIVLVCNHGELYGPIVTNLFVPCAFRPWVTYEMTSKQAIAEYMCRNYQKNGSVLSKPLGGWLIKKIAAPFLAWIMRSVECIPVYHDNPLKLKQTFRVTLKAMLAGDNILLFPENSATTEDHKFARNGVSEFFTGFTMIGTLYYNKTGRCVRFIPVYANQKKRTISFGKGTVYQADNPEEKDRICRVLREEMLDMYGKSDDQEH